MGEYQVEGSLFNKRREITSIPSNDKSALVYNIETMCPDTATNIYNYVNQLTVIYNQLPCEGSFHKIMQM